MAVTSTPLSLSVSPLARESVPRVIEASESFSASVKRKSDAAKVLAAFSAVVTLLAAASGRSLTSFRNNVNDWLASGLVPTAGSLMFTVTE